MTTTTHKSLRGPRGGIVLCEAKFAKQIDSTLFPGVQGGPLMHVIAAKAVCFHEALQPQFREYQRQVVPNAKALAVGCQHGYRIVSGGTDNHLMWVDLCPKEIDGKEAQDVLDRAGITVTPLLSPPTLIRFQAGRHPRWHSGGHDARHERRKMLEIADLVAEALGNRTDADALERVRRKVLYLTRRFPCLSKSRQMNASQSCWPAKSAADTGTVFYARRAPGPRALGCSSYLSAGAVSF